MAVDLKQQLDALHVKDPAEVSGLIDMYVYEDTQKVWVGKTHSDCLPAFREFLGNAFEKADENDIVFGPHLQDFESRTAALRLAIDAIDQNPDIFGEPTQYSLDDLRPIPYVSNPLLAISRPYCRKGFSVPTDCAYMIIKRENGDVLLQKRAENIGISNDATGADNYSGKFDLSANAAHMYDPETADMDALEIHYASLLQKAGKEVGIGVEDVLDTHYVGTTTFKHTRGSRVFHDERHQVFVIKVADDWQPNQQDNDVKETFWASPQQVANILRDMPIEGYSEVLFNNNSRAASVQAFMAPELGILTPERLGQETYDALEAYVKTHQLRKDPVLDAMHSVDVGINTAPETGLDR